MVLIQFPKGTLKVKAIDILAQLQLINCDDLQIINADTKEPYPFNVVKTIEL